MMKRCLSILLPCIAGLAAATGQDSSTITFDEPVVLLSEVHKKAPENITLTGDTDHQPTACWTDQNRLTVRFAEGTSVFTPFRLAFKPGQAIYLSGEPVRQTMYTLTCPRSELQVIPVNGTPTTTFCITPASRHTKEAKEFSVSTPVHYEFREYAYVSGTKIYGRSVAAGVSPATPGGVASSPIATRTALQILAERHQDWTTVNADTIVPSMVMVQPQQQLDSRAQWELRIVPAETSGLKQKKTPSISFTPIDEPGTSVQQVLVGSGGKKEPASPRCSMMLRISFDFPIRISDAPAIFRNISIRANGQEAVNSTDGNTKILPIGARVASFTLLPPVANRRPAPAARTPDGQMITFEPEETTYSLELEVSGLPPTDLDVTIPKGTACAAGLSTVCDHLHRLSFSPAAPILSTEESRTLPLSGEHLFRLYALNTAALELQAWYLDAEAALKWGWTLDGLFEVGKKSPHTTEALKYRLAVEEERLRIEPDKKRQAALSQLRHRISRQEDKLRKFNESVRSVLQHLPTFEPHTMQLPDAAPGELLYSREITADLDTLTGNNTRPGFYIIKVTPKNIPAVRSLVKSLGLSPDTLESAQYFPLYVSDLLVSEDKGHVILTRLSDGSLVRDAEFVARDGRCTPFRQGLGQYSDCEAPPYLVRSGNDFCTQLLHSSEREDASQLRMSIITDRPLYRPGDTVNLRGILRRVSDKGECETEPGIRMLTLTARKPNGEVLIRRDLPPDEFGTWAYSFDLPMGEEDITGLYKVTLTAPQQNINDASVIIPCEVFRRDSFTGNMQLQIDTINPGKFELTLQATDLNGAPLSRAEVQLNLSAHGPDICLNPGETGKEELSTTVTTDAQGKLSLTGYLVGGFEPHHRGVGCLNVSGLVVNDRQEYKKLGGISELFYAADFHAELNGEHLELLTVSKDKELHNEPLQREQKLHVQILGHRQSRNKLPGGIVITTMKEECFFDEMLTLSGDTGSSIRLPLIDIAKRLEFNAPIQVRVSGTDPEGRTMQAVFTTHRWELDIEEEEEEDADGEDGSSINLVHEQGFLKLTLSPEQPGETLLLIQSRRGCRMVRQLIQTVGEELTLPLSEGEDDIITCQMLRTKRGDSGFFTEWQKAEASVRVPRADMQLNVQLDVPGENIRPGSEQTISGRVTLPNGSAAEAEVTLFAVDAGMLSVANYSLPDLRDVFGRSRIPGISLSSISQIEESITLRDFMRDITLLPGVWRGTIIGSGRACSSIHRERYRSRALGAINMEGGEYEEDVEDGRKYAPAPMPMMAVAQKTNGISPEEEEEEEEEEGEYDVAMESDGDALNFGDSLGMKEEGEAPPPRMRTDFAPVAVWQAALKTDENGHFSTTAKLPDTLTTYRVFAVAVGRCGKRFGQAEAEFTVNQPVMITPGTPLFMSLGDCLRLPLTITNNTDKDDTWQVVAEGADTPQSIALKAGSTGTLFFDFIAATEGDTTLRWTAIAAAGGDAVEGKFPVRFPAPVLRELHHLVLPAGAEPLKTATLPAAELASASRSSAHLELSANPLLHLASSMDFVLSYPYGCTEQTSSGLIPWIFHSRLAPFSPGMEAVSPQEVSKVINEAIEKLFKRQQEDGGLGYWGDSQVSCLWATAHAAMVFTLAEENGISLPEDKMKKLRQYLGTRSDKEMKELSAYSRYSIGRACRNDALICAALEEAETAGEQSLRWQNRADVDIRFIAALRKNPTGRHDAFLSWMRSRGHDYRHMTTWQSGWMLVALGEYLRLEPEQSATAAVRLQDGTQLTLGNGITRYTPPTGSKLSELPTVITTTQGTAYLNVKFRALPEQTEYPGVTEKGLQITRVYEKKDAEGNWKPATEFRVGDVVRVTLTCAKIAQELHYFVLEDYLPACMEAINPNIPSQAAGLEPICRTWSRWFDHREYLADRVRGFCTRWGGRDLLNMSYYARVKRAGVSTAPPAEAQLMYEPQIYGLSPNAKIISK